jgi:hypothetical protein
VGNFRRPMGDRITESTNLESIRQCTQRRRMARFPRLPKTNNTNTKFQSYRPWLNASQTALYNFRMFQTQYQDELYARSQPISPIR